MELDDAAIDDALTGIRRRCLAGLGADVQALASLEPATDLEKQLREAGAAGDGEGFLRALAQSDVVVPLSRPAEPGDHVGAPGFPWRVVDGAHPPLVPLFGSEEMTDAAVPAGSPHVTLPFAEVVRNWPGPEHVLCFAPGTAVELTLPADTVRELAAALRPPARTVRESAPPAPSAPGAGRVRAAYVPLLALGLVVAAGIVTWELTGAVPATVLGVLGALVVAGVVVGIDAAARRTGREAARRRP